MMGEPGELPRDGEVAVEVEELDESLPWGGRSPRVLTRAASLLFSRQEPPRHEVDLHPPTPELGHLPVKPPRGKMRGPAGRASSRLFDRYDRAVGRVLWSLKGGYRRG